MVWPQPLTFFFHPHLSLCLPWDLLGVNLTALFALQRNEPCTSYLVSSLELFLQQSALPRLSYTTFKVSSKSSLFAPRARRLFLPIEYSCVLALALAVYMSVYPRRL